MRRAVQRQASASIRSSAAHFGGFRSSAERTSTPCMCNSSIRRSFPAVVFLPSRKPAPPASEAKVTSGCASRRVKFRPLRTHRSTCRIFGAIIQLCLDRPLRRGKSSRIIAQALSYESAKSARRDGVEKTDDDRFGPNRRRDAISHARPPPNVTSGRPMGMSIATWAPVGAALARSANVSKIRMSRCARLPFDHALIQPPLQPSRPTSATTTASAWP